MLSADQKAFLNRCVVMYKRALKSPRYSYTSIEDAAEDIVREIAMGSDVGENVVIFDEKKMVLGDLALGFDVGNLGAAIAYAVADAMFDDVLEEFYLVSAEFHESR